MRPANLYHYLRKRFVSFPREESGQSLLIMALTIFGLVISSMLIVGIGEVTSDQMRVQYAADAAAYAGAQVEADCMAQIAWCNEGMSAIYYHCMRYAVDNTVCAVQAEVSNPEPWWDPEVANIGGVNLPPVENLSIDNTNPSAAVSMADTAKELAEEWIPRGERWLRRLSRIQRGIAIIGPSLVEHQAWHTAQANYYTDEDKDGKHDERLRIAIWPHAQFYPDEPTKVDLFIEKIGIAEATPWEENGWAFTSTTNPDFMMTAIHQDHTEDAADKYTYTYDQYLLTTVSGDGAKTIEPEMESWDPHDSGSKYGGMTQRYRWQEEDGGAREIVFWANGDFDVDGEHVKVDDTGVTVGGKKYGYDDNGNMVVDGETVSEKSEVTVNGVNVGLTGSVSIPFGNGQLTIPASSPPSYHENGMWINFGSSGFDIHYSTPAGWVNVTDDTQARINGLTTANPDGRWKQQARYNYQWGWSNRMRRDRRLHRMRENDDGAAQFAYERVIVGTYLKDMDMLKLAAHGVIRENAWGSAGAPSPQWSLPDDGDTQEYEETAQGLWNSYPDWSRPARDPQDWTDRQFGGFFDMRSGRPSDGESGDGRYAYSQTRLSPYVAAVSNSGVNPYLDPLPPVSPGHSTRMTLVQGDDPDTDEIEVEYYTYVSIANPYTKTAYYPEDADDSLVEDVYPVVSGEGGPGFWIESFADLDILIARMNALDQAFLSRNGSTSSVKVNDVWFSQPYKLFRDDRDSLLKLQVFCPFASMPQFRRAPRYYGPVPEDGDPSDAAYVAEYRDAMSRQPTRLRRYIQHAYQRYNLPTGYVGTPPSFLRNSASSRSMSTDYDIDSGEGERDFYSVVVDFDDPNTFQAPLEVTSDLFRRGLIVGVHAPENVSWVSKLFGNVEDTKGSGKGRGFGLVNPLNVTGDPGEDRLKWTSGHFAIAAARVFVQAPDGSGMITNFDYGSEDDGEDEIGRMTSGYRQKWLESDNNLFEPTWTAALVPIRRTIRLEDVYWPDEMEESSSSYISDNEVSYLMRQLFGSSNGHRNNWWRQSISSSGMGQIPSDTSTHTSSGAITAPPMQGGSEGNSLNLQGQNIDDVVRH